MTPADEPVPSGRHPGGTWDRTVELTVGELAARAGITTSAVRFYEQKGFLFSRRTSGNQRRYHRAMLRRVAFIRASQSVGIPLATIAEFLSELGESESPTPQMWERASRRWLDDIDHRIAVLGRMRSMVGGCVACGCLSMKACALLNPGDRYGADGLAANRLIE